MLQFQLNGFGSLSLAFLQLLVVLCVWCPILFMFVVFVVVVIETKEEVIRGFEIENHLINSVI